MGSGVAASVIFFLVTVGRSSALSSKRHQNMGSSRHTVLKQITSIAITSLALSISPSMALSFSSPSGSSPLRRVKASPASGTSEVNGVNGSASSTTQHKVAYRSLSLDVDFGVKVPVAMWYPAKADSSGGRSSTSPIMDIPLSDSASPDSVTYYSHRISVKRIGELLAGWEFIPDFASKNFQLEPTLPANTVLDGSNLPLPEKGPVVLLAHGYLGSRFDLSHLAEELAQQGFICLSPEYPESLAASYPRIEGLDRDAITSRMLSVLKSELKVGATSFGIVGHSLGCGTAMSTGDDDWTRVLIAGFPRGTSRSRVLWLSSTNDGAVSLSRMGGRAAIPPEYVQLDESAALQQSNKLPPRAALVFDRPDAPNHISFLADGVNDCMIDLLSPLLPVAQALEIPVLDFDKYQQSRDSRETAQVVLPLISSYLKQYML